MGSWKDEYLAALDARDEVEKAHLDFYEAYTRMADRNAKLINAPSSTPTLVEATPPPPPIVGWRGVSAPATPPPVSTTSHAQLRDGLGKAQQERAALQARLDRTIKDLEKLKSRAKVDNKRITQLTSELNQLSIRVRDRDEESRGKAKLLDNVQDEIVTLNLQLNLAEDEVKKLRKENKELVDRWMQRKGEEADKMNEDSRF